MHRWRKLKSKKIHENRWYSLREDEMIRPNGSKGKYYVVNINNVAVIAEDRDGKIYLVGQIRYPVGNVFSWEIIAGGFKKASNPLSVAKRELKEEAGITAAKWKILGHFNPVNGYASQTTYVYLATELEVGKRDLDDTEEMVLKKVRINEVIMK